MRMKLSLAIALSHQARLLIMDEPTSGLDPVFRSELLDILRGYMTEERSILFSTHVTSDLDKIADIVTLIHEGRWYSASPGKSCWKTMYWSRVKRSTWTII